MSSRIEILGRCGSSVKRDLLWLVCGSLLGYGTARAVFVNRLNEQQVIKVTTGDDDAFQNVAEWQVWNELKDTPMARWLAPCIEISGNGLILLQRRTEPLAACHAPKRVPVWLSDLKLSNFGLIGRQFVCHDYGLPIIRNHLGHFKAMRRAKWRTD